MSTFLGNFRPAREYLIMAAHYVQPAAQPPVVRFLSMNGTVSNWLRTLSPGRFVLVLLGASYAVVVPLALLQTVVPLLEFGPGPASMHSLGLPARLLLGSVVAPLIETALFQWAPVRLLQGKLNLPWPFVIVISAALFAATHAYSLGYVIFTFLVGLVLAYGFAVRHEAKDRPFLLVWVVHALRNGVATFFV